MEMSDHVFFSLSEKKNYEMPECHELARRESVARKLHFHLRKKICTQGATYMNVG